MFLGTEDNKRGLKAVLENKKILKLIHDCRNDWDSLLHQYSVRIYNFIDTQEAYFVFKLFYYQEITLPISLLKFIEIMTDVKLEYKEKFKNVMSEDPFMWSNRPLSEEQLAYASEDVIFLVKAWINLRDKFNENLQEIIFFLTILKVVDTTMFDQFREYMIANIIYFGMLENVFSSGEVYAYIFAVDYVYNFLQIKIISDKGRNGETEETFPQGKNNLLPDDHYYKFVKDQKTSESIIKYGLNFKEKQRILSLKQFQDEEFVMKEKNNCEGSYNQYNRKFSNKKKFNRNRSASFENASTFQNLFSKTLNLEDTCDKSDKTASPSEKYENKEFTTNSPNFNKNSTNEDLCNNFSSNEIECNQSSQADKNKNYSNPIDEGSSPTSDGYTCTGRQNNSIYSNNFKNNFSGYSYKYEKTKKFNFSYRNNFNTKNQFSYGGEIIYDSYSTNIKQNCKKEYFTNISTTTNNNTDNKMTSCILQNNENKFHYNKNRNFNKNFKKSNNEDENLNKSQHSSGDEQQKSTRSTQLNKGEQIIIVENVKRYSHEINHTPIKNNKKPKFYYHYNKYNNQKHFKKNKNFNICNNVSNNDLISNLNKEVTDQIEDERKLNRKITY